MSGFTEECGGDFDSCFAKFRNDPAKVGPDEVLDPLGRAVGVDDLFLNRHEERVEDRWIAEVNVPAGFCTWRLHVVLCVHSVCRNVCRQRKITELSLFSRFI